MKNLSNIPQGGNEMSPNFLVNTGFEQPDLNLSTNRNKCSSAVMVASSNLSRMHDRREIRKIVIK